MALTDDEIIHVASIVRQQNGSHWTIDKTIMVAGPAVVILATIGGWIWFGGGFATQLRGHSETIKSLQDVVEAIKEDTLKTSLALIAIKATLDEAQIDRKIHDAKVDDKLDKLSNQLSSDEGAARGRNENR